MNKNCPKCGFYMLNSNCPKCGYESEHIYQKKYQTKPNDLELLLKDEYLKIIHNKNTFMIIFLGPLYFSYYNFYMPSIIFSIIELYIHYIMGINLYGTLGTILKILLFVIDFIALRIMYLSFYNTLLITIFKKKLNKIKKKRNYKDLIYKYQPNSILRPILLASIFILILIII